eukprot:scaffold191739_cov45-Prasinocladus_malaysianus.AAC.1
MVWISTRWRRHSLTRPVCRRLAGGAGQRPGPGAREPQGAAGVRGAERTHEDDRRLLQRPRWPHTN